MSVGRYLRLELLQWFGLLAAPIVWSGQFVVGQGIGEALCNPGGSQWTISNSAWQLALTIAAGLIVVLSEVAAITVFRRTRNAGPDPPASRQYFFSFAAMAGNVVFLAIVLLTGIGAAFHQPCVQA